MSRFESVARARELPGLRLGCLRQVPSPWTEAAKGLFHIKKLACQYFARAEGEPANAMASWSNDAGVPVVAYEREKLRTGWAEILILAERLAPQPALVPDDPEARALVFGLGHEICGEMGLGWSYRLLMIHASLGHGGGSGAFAPAIGNYLAPRYGFNPAHVREARGRVLDVLALLSRRIEGARYLVGKALTAVDVYWATFANLLTPLPHDLLPFSGPLREAYTCTDREILAAISPALRAHQERVYREHLELPVPL
jgi:glutathione S-transferase